MRKVGGLPYVYTDCEDTNLEGLHPTQPPAYESNDGCDNEGTPGSARVMQQLPLQNPSGFPLTS